MAVRSPSTWPGWQPVVGSGSAQVSATYGGPTNTTNAIQVSAAILMSVAMTPASGSLPNGSTLQYTRSAPSLTVPHRTCPARPPGLLPTASWPASTRVVLLPPPVLGAPPSPGRAAALPLPPSSPFRGDVDLGERKPIPQGTTQQFTATGTYIDGWTQNLPSSVAWISSDLGVLSIDTNGLGAADGQTGGVTITVQSSSGATYTSINFAVTGAVLASITVHPQAATIRSAPRNSSPRPARLPTGRPRM